MKTKLAFAIFSPPVICALVLAGLVQFARAQAAAPTLTPPVADQSASVIQALKSQRDQVTSAMQDAQLQIALAGQEIRALNAKVSELQTKIDAEDAKRAKIPATASAAIPAPKPGAPPGK